MAVDRNESFVHMANQVCKEFVFARQDIAFYRMFSDEFPLCGQNAIVSFVEQAQGSLVMAMRAWLLDGHTWDVRKETTDIEFPSTPWEFFKQRYMPRWFIKRYPVKMEVKRVVVAEHRHYLCPHLVVEPDHMHYKWMAVQSGQWERD